jgi:hypothetical protein
MTDWRFYAQRPVSGIWLDTDVAFSGITATRAISAPNSAQATLMLPDSNPLGEDGRPIWGKWDTLLYCEKDGELDQVYIADSVQPGSGGAQLKLIGASGWLARVPYTGVYQVWSTNTFDVMRELLDHANSKPRGIDWVYPSLDSATTVGDPEPGPKPVKPPRHKGESLSDYKDSTRYHNWQDDLAAWQDADGKNQKYKVVFWESPYILDEINNLVEQEDFDWREEYRWVTGQFDPEFKINFADNLSVHRTDIAIIDGDNTQGRLFPTDDDGGYANTVIAIGAGQGRKALKQIVAVDDGRLYAARYFTRKHIHHNNQLAKAATKALNRYRTIDPQIGATNLYNVGGMADVSTLNPGDIVDIRSDLLNPPLDAQARVKSVTENLMMPGRVQIDFETQAGI